MNRHKQCVCTCMITEREYQKGLLPCWVFSQREYLYELLSAKCSVWRYPWNCVYKFFFLFESKLYLFLNIVFSFDGIALFHFLAKRKTHMHSWFISLAEKCFHLEVIWKGGWSGVEPEYLKETPNCQACKQVTHTESIPRQDPNLGPFSLLWWWQARVLTTMLPGVPMHIWSCVGTLEGCFVFPRWYRQPPRVLSVSILTA